MMARRFAPYVWATGVVLLGVWAAWPIYETSWVWVTAALALFGGSAVAWLGARQGWDVPASLGCVTVAGVVLLVPATMPHIILGPPAGWGHGFLSGVAGVVLGWKQLLTVSLPVGSYQALLVPLFVVLLVSVWAVVRFGSRPGTVAAWAAVPMCVPVLFGTVWGSATVSAPWQVAGGAVQAPREIAVWLAVAALALVWVAWVTGAPRRAARARGRAPGERGAGVSRRAAWGAVTVVLALAVGVLCAPLVTSGVRAVPRTELLPVTVLQTQPSPLAAYRVAKNDARIDEPLITFESEGSVPERLRFAVLDAYDGVEFRVGSEQAAQFTRYPSGPAVPEPVELSVQVGDGYSGVWLPGVGAGSSPEFSGERSSELTDAVFVNRSSESAIVVPGGERSIGLQPGDRYRVTVSAAPVASVAELVGGPTSEAALIDVTMFPELDAWVRAQQQPATVAGLTELVQRLRDRGYLSHALAAEPGTEVWSQRLAAEYGSVFVPSPGGHSVARIEALFAQLNAQQQAAVAEAGAEQLVAAVGDDEQFATAAALVARALGFESRVVLGVRLHAGQSDNGTDAVRSAGAAPDGVPSCDTTCTGVNVAAWVEVRDAAGQWGVLDVTPQAVTAPILLAEGSQLAEFETPVIPRDAAPVDAPTSAGDAADAATGDTSDAVGPLWLWPLLRAISVVVAAVLLLAVPWVCVWWIKRRRSRWRRAETDPEQGALAAWYEFVDQVRDAGVRVGAGQTRAQIAQTVGTPAARWLAAEVDRAVWSPGSVTPDEVAVLWAVVDAEGRALRAGLTRWGRLRLRCSLRSVRPEPNRRGAAHAVVPPESRPDSASVGSPR